MKKLFLTLGLASLFMVACNNTPKQPETSTESVPEEKTEIVEQKQECPMHAIKEDLASIKAEYANWDGMSDKDKATLNQKAADVFTKMNTMMAEMKEKGEGCAKDMEGMTEEQKQQCEQKCAEMKEAWDKFPSLTPDEQKDFILQQLEGCDGDKPCCKHEGEEGHQCQHDAQ